MNDTGITDFDMDLEGEMAALIAERWNVQMHYFGKYNSVDWYMNNEAGRMLGLVELKCRSHASTDYKTVFMSVRKWLSLTLAETALGVPSFYVVRWSDCAKWIRVRDVPTSDGIQIGGWHTPRRPNDKEPVINVPIRAMSPL